MRGAEVVGVRQDDAGAELAVKGREGIRTERADYVVNGAVPPEVLDRISELLRLCPPGSQPGQCG